MPGAVPGARCQSAARALATITTAPATTHIVMRATSIAEVYQPPSYCTCACGEGADAAADNVYALPACPHLLPEWYYGSTSLERQVVAMLATSAIRLVLTCAVLCTPMRMASADEFACSLNITGSSTFPEDLKYSSVLVECSSRTQDLVQLPLLLHNSLEPHKGTINGTGILKCRQHTVPFLLSLLCRSDRTILR